MTCKDLAPGGAIIREETGTLEGIPLEAIPLAKELSTIAQGLVEAGFVGSIDVDYFHLTDEMVLTMTPEGWEFGDCCMEAMSHLLMQDLVHFTTRNVFASYSPQEIRAIWKK